MVVVKGDEIEEVVASGTCGMDLCRVRGGRIYVSSSFPTTTTWISNILFLSNALSHLVLGILLGTCLMSKTICYDVALELLQPLGTRCFFQLKLPWCHCLAVLRVNTKTDPDHLKLLNDRLCEGDKHMIEPYRESSQMLSRSKENHN